MSDYIGTRKQVDEYAGSRLVEAAYLGSHKYFDAYTELETDLPVTFDARAEHNLKNYQVHGTEVGAGVQTENWFDWTQPLTSGYYILADGRTISSSGWATTDYIPVSGNVFTLSKVSGGGAAICAYDGNKDFLFGKSYQTGGYDVPADITVIFDSSVSYVRFCFYPSITPANTIMLTPGSTAPTSYIPPGYKIPILNTSGVTENKFDYYARDENKGYVSNKHINSDGNETDSAYYSITEYMSVLPNLPYAIKWDYRSSLSGTSSVSMAFYDESKAPVSVEVYNNRTQFVVTSPNTAKSVRFSYIRNAPQNAGALYVIQSNVLPDHYIPHRYETDYNLYIGDSKLGKEEYVDFQEQKIYKDVSGTLTPTDPPAPLPAIQAYKGENTLSSTETVGEVMIKGRIHRQTEWTNLEWAPYPSLSFVALSEPVHLLPGKYYAWQEVVGTADFGVMVMQPEALTGGIFGTDGYYTIDAEGDYCLQINKNGESKTYTQQELDALSSGSGIELKTQRMLWTDMAWEVSALDSTVCVSSHIHLYPGWYVLSQSTISSYYAFVIQPVTGGNTIWEAGGHWTIPAEGDYFIQINKRGGDVTAAELQALSTDCTMTAERQTS